MTDLPRGGADIALLSTGKRDEPPEPPKSASLRTARRPKTRNFLRHARLQTVGRLFRLSADEEPRKVAIYQSRTVALFHCMLHLVPLSGAIVLLVLRSIHFWVGMHPVASSTLQFVAKFHELLMQVSIIEIMLCIVRSEAVNSFVPLGALSGAIQATQLSYLWSLDFLSLLTSTHGTKRSWNKVAMIIAIPALLILTALVGPSSAALMISEPGMPKVYARYPWRVAEQEDAYPTHLNLGEGPDLNSSMLRQTLTKYMARVDEYFYSDSFEQSELQRGFEMTYLYRDQYDRYLRSFHRTMPRFTAPFQWQAAESIATLPTNLAIAAIQQSGIKSVNAKEKNTTLSAVGSYPVVTVRCLEGFGETGANSSNPQDRNEGIYFIQEDGLSVQRLDNVSSIARRVTSQGMSGNYTSGFHQFFDPIWLGAPEPDTSPLVGVFFRRISSNTSTQPLTLESVLSIPSEDKTESLYLTTCSVSAYWTWGAMLQIPNENLEEFTYTEPISKTDHKDKRKAIFNATGIEKILDANYHAVMCGTSSLDCPRSHISLVASFILGISHIPDTTRNQTGRARGPDKRNYVTALMYGYGYGTSSPSIRLAMAVIATYCVITVLYFACILVTGTTSTAWNSAVELVALALQSSPPDHLGNASVGMDCLDTFNKSVGIRVNAEDKLELVFAGDRDLGERGLRKIERNVAY
ncbi:hypothetical protein OPT61_g9698 [Boeremia exigua]|uniref:Uncharacterized protein n=1 Tax=Boeremia exigua TaxID=749465 RepID=A0ACC2HSZ0_9PLEO|nr:hypothetical protein OPT61_g9698 [Boeremia exigua]